MRKVLIPLLAALLSFCAKAQEGSSSVIYTFSIIELNPVSAAMGGVSLANTGNLSWSSFSNPSLIPFSPVETAAAVSWQGQDGNNFSIAGGYNAGKAGFSAGVSYLVDKGYPVYDAGGGQTGNFKPTDLRLGASVGLIAADSLSIGATVSYLRSSLSSSKSYNSAVASLFVSYKCDALVASAGISRLGTKVNDGSGFSYDLPTSLSGGISYDYDMKQGHRLLADADLNYFLSNGFTAALGVQYSYDNTLFLRAGYNYADRKAPLPSFFGIGAGVHYEGLNLGLSYTGGAEGIMRAVCVAIGYNF